ncbi:MAG: GTP-binding protein [Candidatus Helarchaeota archaeon]|nr:GTP-binding protein [Candidatus Helarchaeota archaeon]
MEKSEKDVLKGIVISKFGEMGPEAIAWYPEEFANITLTEISIKSVSILAGEDGAMPPPEHLSVLSLPKLHMTAVIFVFELTEPEARGGVILATISVLFNEKYTSVIYKTMEDLVKLITPMESLKDSIKNNEDITGSLKTLFNQLKEFLDSCQQDEITRYQIAAQVQKQYKHKYSFKVVVIGDPRVGKTTLLLRFVDKAFRELYIPTLGVQVSLKNMDYKDTTLVKYNLWDIAGQDLFNKVRNNFYKGSNAVLILYDVTNPKTFDNVEHWYLDLSSALGEKPGFLIGNKIDLPRQINRLDGKDLAEKLDLSFIETSAKTGENVDKIFEDLAERLIKMD